MIFPIGRYAGVAGDGAHEVYRNGEPRRLVALQFVALVAGAQAVAGPDVSAEARGAAVAYLDPVEPATTGPSTTEGAGTDAGVKIH